MLLESRFIQDREPRFALEDNEAAGYMYLEIS